MQWVTEQNSFYTFMTCKAFERNLWPDLSSLRYSYLPDYTDGLHKNEVFH